jgi:uncharacterized membrane protein YkoI
MLKYIIITLALGCGGRQDKDTVPPPNLPVSMEQARTSALAAVPGQVQAQELDTEDGRWVYEFEIQPATAGMPKQEVDVDATTGAVQVDEAD